MGIYSFAKWLKARLEESKREEISADIALSSLSIDMNALVYNAIDKILNDNNRKNRIENKIVTQDEFYGYIFSEIKVIIYDIIKNAYIVRPKQKLQEDNINYKIQTLIMAFDGVAPLAKISQQRDRRYKSSTTIPDPPINIEQRSGGSALMGVGLTEIEQQTRVRKPDPLTEPAKLDKSIFDRNCISPGTPFMQKLDHVMALFVDEILATQKVRHVVYSSHLVVGEGEQKIIDYLKAKTDDGTDYFIPGNGYHLIYAMDSDFFLLCMAANLDRPNLMLFREEKVGFNMKENNFYDINKLISTFIKKHKMPIADFILIMCFVGNDFLPPLIGFEDLEVDSPNLNPLDVILDTYIKVGKKLCIYEKVSESEIGIDETTQPQENVNPTGEEQIQEIIVVSQETPDDLIRQQRPIQIHRENFLDFLIALIPIQMERIKRNIYKQYDYPSKIFSAIKNKWNNPPLVLFPSGSDFGTESNEESSAATSELLLGKQFLSDVKGEYLAYEYGPKISSTGTNQIALNVFANLLRSYDSSYTDRILNVDQNKISTHCENYLAGLAWVLQYYFHGMKGLNFNFVYNYIRSPFLDDFVNVFGSNGSVFETILGTVKLAAPILDPTWFSPLEQLITIIPAASYNYLPSGLKFLYTDKSPIFDITRIQGFSFDIQALSKRHGEKKAKPILPPISTNRIRQAIINLVSLIRGIKLAAGQILEFDENSLNPALYRGNIIVRIDRDKIYREGQYNVRTEGLIRGPVAVYDKEINEVNYSDMVTGEKTLLKNIIIRVAPATIRAESESEQQIDSSAIAKRYLLQFLDIGATEQIPEGFQLPKIFPSIYQLPGSWHSGGPTKPGQESWKVYYPVIYEGNQLITTKYITRNDILREREVLGTSIRLTTEQAQPLSFVERSAKITPLIEKARKEQQERISKTPKSFGTGRGRGYGSEQRTPGARESTRQGPQRFESPRNAPASAPSSSATSLPKRGGFFATGRGSRLPPSAYQ